MSGAPPATVASLAADLARLGVTTGDTVMVHTSMRSLGYVVGGEVAVLGALRTAVGTAGTLVMPTQSWQLCDPVFLHEPHVPEAWWSTLREHLPAYDPRRTPTRTMGVVAELFRTQPGSSRSSHPHRSITANGPRAAEIVARHDLDCPAGERSPLAALYAVGGTALLLGVGPDKLTCLHLAEHRARFPGRQLVANGGPVLVDGVRRWLTWEELQVEDDDFPDVVAAFEADGGRVRSGAARSVRPGRSCCPSGIWSTSRRGGSASTGRRRSAADGDGMTSEQIVAGVTVVGEIRQNLGNG